MVETIKGLKNISVYSSAYDLLEENMDREFFCQFSDDDLSFLRGFDDFEFCTYFLLNYESVIVADSSGSIEGDALTIPEFVSEIMRLLQEYREERDS